MRDASADPMPTVERLLAATNAHDVEGIVACFAEGYALESPLHPARSFHGKDQVRRNWTQILSAVGDLKASLVGSARDGRIAWTEWEMVGTRRDGGAHHMRGVFVFRIESGLIQSGRMFLEPVDTSTADANEGLRRALTPQAADGPQGGTP
jgi:ketosteroid isomerase-like protein